MSGEPLDPQLVKKARSQEMQEFVKHGVYVKGKYVSSFIGFVPARNPQLLTLVVVDEPNVPWGGSVAAPAFEQISEFALQYLAIPPDGIL